MKRTIMVILLFSLILPTYGYEIQGNYQNLEGESISFSKFQGLPLVIEAFATDCSHCHDYHSELVKIWNKYNGSIQLLSLSIKNDETFETMNSYLNDYPSPWEIGFDIENNFQNQFDIFATPTTLFFDSNGEFAVCKVGTQTFSSLDDDLSSFLSDPSGFKENQDSKESCPQPSRFSQFLNSILFPISLGIIVYVVYLSITQIRDKQIKS